MLWSSHPQNPHCDAAGPEAEGTNHWDRRCSLLVWPEPSNFREPVPTVTRKVGFDLTRHNSFLMILSRSVTYDNIEESRKI